MRADVKRFYKEVGVEEKDEGSFAVTVDGRVVKTPMRAPLVLPSEALAVAVAQEWDAQRTHIEPLFMPLTKFASTVLDRYPEVRDKVTNNLVKYLASDSLAFRNHNPGSLAALQHKKWDPVVEWVGQNHGVVLDVTDGLMPSHPAQSAEALRKYLDALDDWQLVGFDRIAASTRSVTLSLALTEGHLSPEQTLALSRLEEEFQTGVWGVVEGGHDIDETVAMVDLTAADVYLRILQLSQP